MIHAQGMFATIDGEYTKVLGYENLVGSYCMINDAMKALCNITILKSNDTALIGSQHDIHKEDLKLEPYYLGEEEDRVLHVLVDHLNCRILYSENKMLIRYLRDATLGYRMEYFPAIKEMHEVIDFLSNTYSNGDIVFRTICLDNLSPDDKEEAEWVKTFNKREEMDARIAKLSQKQDTIKSVLGQVKETKANPQLLDSLKKQVAEQNKAEAKKDRKPRKASGWDDFLRGKDK